MIPLIDVPLNKQLLWFFDDEMTHDLVFIPTGIPHDNHYTKIESPIMDKIILVERATIYGYPPREGWVENLFNALLPHSELVKSQGETFGIIGNILSGEVEVTIPAVSQEDAGKPLILAYHTPTVELIYNRVVEYFHLHYVFLRLRTTEQKRTLNCLRGSCHAITDIDSIKTTINDSLNESIEFEYLDEATSLQITHTKYSATSCKLADWRRRGYAWQIPSVAFMGDPILEINTEVLSSVNITYPQRGAIIYSYPQHGSTIKHQITDNLIVGNVILQDADYSYFIALNGGIEGVTSTIVYYDENEQYEPNRGLFKNREISLPISIVPDEYDENNFPLSKDSLYGMEITCLIPVDKISTDTLDDELGMSGLNINQSSEWLQKRVNYHLRTEGLIENNIIYNSDLPYKDNTDFEDYLNSLPLDTPTLKQWVESLFVSYPEIVPPDNPPSSNPDITYLYEKYLYFSEYYQETGGTDNYAALMVRTSVGFRDLSFYPYESYSPSYTPPVIPYEQLLIKYIEEMNSNLMLQEIHACLGAGEFAYSEKDPPLPAYMNIGRRLDLLCKAFGVMFDLDGEEIVTRPPRFIEQGNPIPVGWYFDQFAKNTGGMSDGQQGGEPDEERLGIVYQVRSNRLITDASGEPKEIKRGGFVLCENWIQYFEMMLADLDRAIDWQDLGAGIMSFNGKTFVNEGLFDILQEMHIVSADTNQTTEQSRISSLVTQQLAKEILKGLGLPTTVKKINFKLQNEDTSGQSVVTEAEIPYNGVADQSPTVASLIFMLLENIAMGNIGKLQINDEEALAQNPPTEPDKQLLVNQEDVFNNALQIIQDWAKQATIKRK